MRVPVRIYNHVDVAGLRRPYDLLWPVLHQPAKDAVARVVEVARTSTGASGTAGPGQAEKNSAGVRRADTAVDLQTYALQLLASLPAPSDEAARLQASIGPLPRPLKADMGIATGGEDGSEITGCREAVEILTRNMRKGKVYHESAINIILTRVCSLF